MTTLPQQLRHLLARYDAAIRELNHSGNGSRAGPEFERLVREKIALLSHGGQGGRVPRPQPPRK